MSSSTIIRTGRSSAIHFTSNSHCERQADPERRACAFLASDLERASDLAQVFAAFEGANAHSVRLRRLKRCEQFVADECLTHAATVVLDLDRGLVAISPQSQVDATVRTAGFGRILQQV